MSAVLTGTILRPDGSPYRGASFRIHVIPSGGASSLVKTIVAGDSGFYSLTINPPAGAIYQFEPLSTGLPPEFYFPAPANGTTQDVLALAPVGIPITVDAAAVLTAALNSHIADVNPHPNFDPVLIHDQTSPSSAWHVTHGYGRKVQAQLLVGNQMAISDIEVTDTYVHVTFPSPQTGQLVLS